MAQPTVTAPSPPPVMAEQDPAPPPPQLLSSPVKQEEETQQGQHYTIITPYSPSLEQLQSQPPQGLPSSSPIPHFINSINELRHLSEALSAFHRCYDDLQTHLDSIQSALDTELTSQTSYVNSSTHEILPIVPPSEPISIPSQEEEKQTQNGIQKPIHSELQGLCLTMSGRCLRKYMVTNLSEAKRLREEVPKALKLAHNPAKLVLECVGRFFLQGSKAYTKDSPMVHAREASVLMLECFLLMECDDGVFRIEKEIKEEAEQAAISWRKRLISEGGLATACEIDARGLLMFIACFGVAGLFRIKDYRDLVRAGNAKDISGVLKRSRVLMAKISEIIEEMVKIKMAVDAVDIAYTFGLKDKLSPQTIMTSFLRESREAWKRTTKSSQGSLAAMNDANKKYLNALQSVIKCLESHKIDSSKFLSGWKINEAILGLEKDITDFDKKIREQAVQKRKADETESQKLKNQEVKRPRYADQVLLSQQQVSVHLDSQRNLLDDIYGHMNRSSDSPSVLHGAGVSGRISTVASYNGIYGEAQVDTAGQTVIYSGQPYGLRGDSVYSERLAAHTFAGQSPSYGLTSLYRTSPYLEGFPGLPSSSTVGIASRSTASDLYQFADSVVDSESYHHSSISHSAAAAAPVVPAHHSSYLFRI